MNYIVPDPRPYPRRIALPRLKSQAQARLEVWGQWAHTNVKLMRRIERLMDSQGMTLAQLDVLTNLELHEGLTQQELAQRLQVTKGNICGLIDRLEAAKWVERRPDAVDRRANRLHLTAAGRAMLFRIRPLHDETVLRLLKTFSDDEISTFQTLLERLDGSAAEE